MSDIFIEDRIVAKVHCGEFDSFSLLVLYLKQILSSVIKSYRHMVDTISFLYA